MAVPTKPENLFWRTFSLLIILPIIFLGLFVFSIFAIMAPMVRAKFINERRDQTVNLTMLAANAVNALWMAERDGLLSRETAQKNALERIESLRYGKDGSGYFWAFDERGTLLVHALLPEQAGKEIEEVDPEYREVLAKVKREVLSVQAAKENAFVTYEWIRTPGSTERFLKTSYMLYFAPWKWVIGTGLDMSAFEKEIDRFLFWIIVAGVGLCLASFLFSLRFAYRLTESKLEIRRAKTLIDESERLKRAKEEQFETIFNTSLFGISIVRKEDNVFVRVNEAFSRITEFPPEEILGRTAMELGIFSDQDCRELSRSISGGEPGKGMSGFVTLKAKSGQEKTMSISMVAIDIVGVPHSVTIISDVSELKRLQEQLTQVQKMDTVGQLAGGIAHDFNNMLTGIMGSAEVLSVKLDEEPEEKRLVEVIMEAAQRAAELTSKLLAFSRRGKIVSTPIDVHESIKAAIALLERSIDKRIKISSDLGAERSMITGDPSLIQNAFLNIAINARDAMPDGGEIAFMTRNVDLRGQAVGETQSALPDGPYIEIDIRDTGTGIPKDVLPRIFEPFFTTKPRGQGTGLGLPAVYGTVKEHQGNVNVYSEVGKGTEFKILLPLSAEQSPRGGESRNDPAKGHGRILVVDDESIIRNTVYSMLTNLGYSVMLAEDGESGIRLYRENRESVDLVILDMVMPGLGGKDTCQRLKKEFPDIKIVFSSGFNPAALKGDAEKLEGVDFIQKPYRMAELGDIVARNIGRGT